MVGVAAIAGIVALAVFRGTPEQFLSSKEAADTADAETSEENGPAPVPVSASPRPASSQTQSQPSGINFTAPLAGEKLIIGQSYIIRWSKEGGTTGFIYLSNAETKEIVGWLNSETGAHDTQYTWDVRDVFLSRYSPTKNLLDVGKYVISIGFDSRLASITSGVFEVIYPSQFVPESYNVTVRDFNILPESLTVKKGGKLVFANESQISHRIAYGSAYFSLSPGSNHVFDTSILFPGIYDFYSVEYPTTARISVSVQ